MIYLFSKSKINSEVLLMSIQPTLSQPTFMVGNPMIAQQFSQLILKGGSTACVEKDPLAEQDDDHVFGRDSRVIGLNKVHLLPYPIKDPLLEGYFKALLPSSANSLVESTVKVGFAKGFTNENVKSALLYAKNHHLPYRQMLSCLEGGNSYVFFDSDDLPKAIVGIFSLILTVIGLEEQGYFVEHSGALHKLSGSITAPSDDAVRAARNMCLYYTPRRDFDSRFAAYREQRQKMDLTKSMQLHKSFMEELRKTWTSETAYRKLLTAPIKGEDRINYFKQACVWEAKITLARQAIADDLHVPVENIAFVPQTHFHIDMEMFVAPNGKDVYVDKASFQPAVTTSLKSIGCTVVSLPGVCEGPSDSINFMNGVFVSTSSGALFVTNGVRRQHGPLLELFQRTLLSTNPSFRIDFLNETMQDVLTRKSGGIHCLTWEKPNYSTPLDIILSYSADEPVSEKILRKQVSDVLRL